MPKDATIGSAAFAAAVLGTALAPVHALSRYATEEGRADLDLPGVRAWAEPAAQLLDPLLTWADADTVYLTYGKLWFPVFLAATMCAFAVRRRRRPGTAETWAWRVALTGYVLSTASLVGDYWTPYLEESFLFLGLPGLLLSLLGSTWLGAVLLRRGYRPRSSYWLLLTWIPALVALSSLVALAAAAMPMVWAWGLSGREMAARDRASAEPVPAAA